MKTNDLKTKLKIDPIVLLLIIFLLSLTTLTIGFSALSTNLGITGDLSFVPVDYIVVGDIEDDEDEQSCGYNQENPRFEENAIIINGVLPSLECVLQYNIRFINTASVVMEIMDIIDVTLTNSNIFYEIEGIEISTLIDSSSEISATIKFYYNPSVKTLPQNTALEATIFFQFDIADIVPYNNGYVSDGLLLLYDAKNNTGHGYRNNITKWEDLVGDNNGKLINDPTWDSVSLLFDGVNDKVQFVGDIPQNYTITISFIADFNNPTSWTRLFSENPFPSLYVNLASGVRTLRLYGQNIDGIFPNFNLTPERTQATITYNGSYIRLYINGQQISNLNTSTNPTSVPFAYLGGRELDNLRQFMGRIYTFMIYDRVLDPTEIADNYDNAKKDEGIVPIQNATHLSKIGSNEIVSIGDQLYQFSPDAQYIVENNLSFSYAGTWNPNLSSLGSITTYDKVITITDTNDSSIHYYQNQLYVTQDNAIKDGLVLHYDAINNTGSGHSSNTLTWKDLAGNNDASLLNGPVWSNNKLTFDGVNDKASFVGNITSTYSIVATVKPEKVGTYPRVVSDLPFPTIYFHSTQNYPISFYSSSADKPFAPNYIPLTTATTYIIVTFSNNTATLYVNGRKWTTMTGVSTPAAVATAYLGGRAANDRQYTGDIYNFMIYNRELTEFEAIRSYITNYSKYYEL